MLPRVAFTTEDDEPPAETFQAEGRTIRRQPPYVVQVCQAPPSGRASWPCGYRNAMCGDGSAKCQACKYRYCKYHFMMHMKLVHVPPEAWRSFNRELHTQVRQVVQGTRKRIRLPKATLTDEEE